MYRVFFNIDGKRLTEADKVYVLDLVRELQPAMTLVMDDLGFAVQCHRAP